MTQIQNATPPWPSITDDDGTGQTGTALNKVSFWDVIRDAINDLLHSATNPTVTPADVIDEVVEARGSMPDLDARLDVSLNEDGTLKDQADLVTQTDLKHQAGPFTRNGDLTGWDAGAALAPNDFVLSGAGAAVVKTGAGEADTFSFLAGQYAAKLTFGAALLKLTQTIYDSTEFAKRHKLRGVQVTVGMWGRSSIASHLAIVIDDGVTTTRGGQGGNGTYHTGGGSDEWLYATHTISMTATKLEFYVEVSQAGTAYAGGFNGLYSDIAIDRWMPIFLEASRVQPGIVTLFQQILKGLKIFVTQPRTYIGGADNASGGGDDYQAEIGGVYFRDVIPITIPGGTTNGTLLSSTFAYGTSPSIRPNMLNADGKGVRIFLGSSTAHTGANNKSITCNIGGTAITIIAAAAANYTFWHIEILIIRIDSDSVDVWITGKHSSGFISGEIVQRINGLDFTNTIGVQLLGTTGAASTLTKTYSYGEAL